MIRLYIILNGCNWQEDIEGPQRQAKEGRSNRAEEN